MFAPTATGNEVMYQDLLGSPVNILEKPNIFDLKDIIRHKISKRIITLSQETKEVSVPGIKGELTVKKNVDCWSSGIETNSTDIQVDNGSELMQKLTASADLNDAFLGMKLTGGAKYSYENSVKKSSMYALMAIDQIHFYTALTTGDKEDDLDQGFLAAVKNLPLWSEVEEVKSAYKDFFNTWGTHVIKKCNYGSRFTLKVETENAAYTSKTDYEANIKAEYGDVFSTSANVSKGDTFENYQKRRKTASSVIGGDQESSLSLERDPGNREKYDRWAKTNNEANNSAVTGITVDTLPQLLHNCDVTNWKQMDSALEYFTKNDGPQPLWIHGCLFTTELKKCDYLNIFMQNASKFYLYSTDGGSATDGGAYNKYLYSKKRDQWDKTKNVHRFTGTVEIYGETGEPFTISIGNEYSSKGIELWLFPPNGRIKIYFDRDQQWNNVTLPHLLASGVYRSSEL